MKPDPAAGRRAAIEQALFEFHQAGDRSPSLREPPPILLSAITEVLQLAIGRQKVGAGAAAPDRPVQEAACAFVRTRLLFSQADHYALLGLDHQAGADAVKERYRLMMRLLHPDFGGGTSAIQWPADAASRINRAYEVLGSAVNRKNYDHKLAEPVAPRENRATIRPTTLRAVSSPPAADPRRFLKQLAAVFGGVGALALLALLLAGGPDKDSLVQRGTDPGATVASMARNETSAPASAPLTDTEAPPAGVLLAAADTSSGGPPGLPVLPALTLALPAAPPPANEPPSESRVTVAPVVTMPGPIRVAEATPAPVATPLATTTPPSIAPAQAAPTTTTSTLPPVAAPMPAATPKPRPGVTLAEAHPLLSRLLQQMENGGGERLLSQLDRDARTAPGAQALVQQYSRLTEGARAVKVAHVEFKAEPRDNRLLVTGYVLLEVADYAANWRNRELSVQAEFAQRDGTVVMTRLGRGPVGGSPGDKGQ